MYNQNTTRKRPIEGVVTDAVLLESVKLNEKEDISLNAQILSDLEFGVGHRPTLPSCFDDEDAVNQGTVDRDTDMRQSSWDTLAEACNPVNVTKKEVTPTVEVETEPIEKSE